MYVKFVTIEVGIAALRHRQGGQVDLKHLPIASHVIIHAFLRFAVRFALNIHELLFTAYAQFKGCPGVAGDVVVLVVGAQRRLSIWCSLSTADSVQPTVARVDVVILTATFHRGHFGPRPVAVSYA